MLPVSLHSLLQLLQLGLGGTSTDDVPNPTVVHSSLPRSISVVSAGSVRSLLFLVRAGCIHMRKEQHSMSRPQLHALALRCDRV